jgi:hypothetical protein
MLVATVPHLHVITLLVCVTLGVLGVAIALGPRDDGTSKSLRRSLLAATAIAIVLRAAFSLVQIGAVYDINSYAVIGGAVRHGVNVYSSVGAGHYNYPPVEMWWSALASTLFPGGPTDQFATLVKIPFWLADAAIVPTLAWLAPAGRQRQAAWLYALNPIAITVACLHGQFDALVVLPLLLAVGCLRKDQLARSALLFGVATAVKTWPLLVLPPILSVVSPRRWARYVALAAVPGGAVTLAYLAIQHDVGISDALNRVFGYVPPATQSFGITLSGSSAAVLGKLDLLIAVLVVGVAVLEYRRGRSLESRVALATLLIVALSPTVGNQYYVWPIAFLLVAGRMRVAAAYTMLVGPAVAYVALNVNAPPFVATPPLYARGLFVIATISLVGLAGVLLYELIATSRSASGSASRGRLQRATGQPLDEPQREAVS